MSHSPSINDVVKLESVYEHAAGNDHRGRASGRAMWSASGVGPRLL